MKKLICVPTTIGLCLLLNLGSAHGSIITPAGTAAGFSATTFATSGGNYPYIAAAVLSNGTLAVVDFGGGSNGRINQYQDVDNQTPANVMASVSFPGAVNIANAGGATYAIARGGGLDRVDLVAGALVLTPIATQLTFLNGLWGNPINGHLLADATFGGHEGLYDVNPLTGLFTVVGSGAFDGVSISPDGAIAYGADYGGNRVLGFSLTNINPATPVYDSGFIGGVPDGIAVISGGSKNGYLVVNTNFGGIVLIDPTPAHNKTIIATGFARGDFVSANSNDGSLFLADLNITYRLRLADGTIGSTAAVPEPASLAIWGLGALGGAIAGYRRRSLA